VSTGQAPAQGLEFAVFFRSSYPILIRVLSAGADDVEDAAQEAFIQAHLNWSKVSLYEDPMGWVRLVAARRLMDRDRGRARGARAVVRLDKSEEDGQPASTLDLANQVRALPPRQRMAVALFYFWDLPEREVAETMGVSLGTVKATLSDARRSLRMQLENDNVD
jgi:RNA polymerase sigma-70 factor, ECF subfamily